MIRAILLILGLSVQNFSAAELKDNKKNNLSLDYCSHYGAGVSSCFQSCVNSNFKLIETELNLPHSNTNNFKILRQIH